MVSWLYITEEENLAVYKVDVSGNTKKTTYFDFAVFASKVVFFLSRYLYMSAKTGNVFL